MVLNIKLFATFRNGRFAQEAKEFEEGTRIENIVSELGIPKEEIGIILVGGRHQGLDYEPNPGETIALFPLLGGG